MNDIRCLVPDLPKADELLPWLNKIDENRWYSNFGPLVQAFEKGVEELMTGLSIDRPMHVCTTSSGTTAIEVAILAHELEKGSRILIPGLTFPGTINAIIQAECRPIISDVDPKTWCLTPTIAKEVFKYFPFQMVMPVSTYGYPLDIEGWQAFHEETGIPVLIDAAGAFGYQQLGDGITVVFSMHATKIFGIGEGGCVVSSDEGFIQNVRQMTNFGFAEGQIRKWGTNAKLSEYHAAVGMVQLERWPAMKAKRNDIYQRYMSLIEPTLFEWQHFTATKIPSVLMINCKTNGELVSAEMLARGIETRRWYCPPLYRHDAYTQYKTASAQGYPKLPVIDEISKGLIGLPYHNFLSIDDVNTVFETLMDIIDETSSH